MTWNTPRSVAVESCGFYAASPIWRKKGKTYILLSSDQMEYVHKFFPQECRWQVDGCDRREVSGYQPHVWLGYSETDAPGREHPIGSSRGDLIIDAGALLDLMTRTETRRKCDVRNGTRTVTALLQAACGLPTTGRCVAVHACEACEGKGATGDYSRGTGRQCAACEGSGEVRDKEPEVK